MEAAYTEPSDVTVLAKPPVRKLARDLGVDLRTVRGSGPAGSITRADVGAVAPPGSHLAGSREWADHPAHGPGGAPAGSAAIQADNRIPVPGMRKAMADAMTRSAFTAPQATVFLTVDATETVALRAALAARPDFPSTPSRPWQWSPGPCVSPPAGRR